MPSLATALNPLRSWLRRTGLSRLFLRHIPGAHDRWCREYRADPLAHAPVSVGSLSCDILTADVDEYCKVRMCGYDRKILRFLVQRLRPGDQCWDIGASIGVYSVILGRAVGPRAAFYVSNRNRDPWRGSREMWHSTT